MLRFTTLFLLVLAIGVTWMVAPLFSLAGLQSMFQPGVGADPWATSMVLLSILTFVAGFWAAFLSQVLPVTWAGEAAGLPLSTDSSGALHVQMPNFPPLHLLHILALFVPFLMYFAVALAGATTAAVTIGWLLIFAALIGGPLWILQRRRAGHFDFELHSADVSVPAMHGRKVAERIARKEIDGVHMWRIVRRGRGGGAFYRVSLKTKSGGEPMLAEWRADYERAQAFASWLSKRLGVACVDKC